MNVKLVIDFVYWLCLVTAVILIYQSFNKDIDG